MTFVAMLVGFFLVASTDASAQPGKSKGIGPQVSQAARSGLHGQDLSRYVHNLQAANGILGNQSGASSSHYSHPSFKAGKGHKNNSAQNLGSGQSYLQGLNSTPLYNTKKPKGNNGLGNGVDPAPPGNPPVNDGPGHTPGNPGNRGLGHR